MIKSRVVVITGAGSGIGLATAELFAKKGDVVYGLCRTPFAKEGITHIKTDVADPASVQAAIDQIFDWEDRIDVLINNAGSGISGAIEFTDPQDAQRQLDVNFFGTFRCTQAILPHMRAQKEGCILCVSSMAGVLPIPFQSFYSASKAAINSFAMALANEVRPHGIRVAALLPGDIKTGFTAARKKEMAGATEYPAMGKSIRTMEHDEQNGMPPLCIAQKLYDISCKRRPKPLYTVGFSYQAFLLLNKLLPARLINFLLGKIYA